MSLIIRSLNSARSIHAPTYVGLRYFANSLVSNTDSGLGEAIITRHFPSSYPPCYRIVKRLKNLQDNGQHEYRDMLIPSPLTFMAEAKVLKGLSNVSSLRPLANVYSYRFPEDDASNFQPYYPSYCERNEEIAKALNGQGSSVVFVFDIRNFYPSIPMAGLAERLIGTAERGELQKSDLATLKGLAEASVRYCDGKLPVGPELSHIIANFYLRGLDEKLNSKFGSNYFRYVDDIIIVARPGAKDDTEKLLKDELDKLGLQLNSSKQQMLTGDQWREYGPPNSVEIGPGTLSSLVFAIKVFSAKNGSDEFTKLCQKLSDSGVNLPFERMRQGACQPNFLMRVQTLIRKGWSPAEKAATHDPSEIVQMAKTVRSNCKSKLKVAHSTASKMSDLGVSTRFLVQRINGLARQLMYFSDNEQVKNELLPIIECYPELLGLKIVADCITSGDASEIIQLPGPNLAFYCGLHNAKRLSMRSLGSYKLKGPADLEGMATMQLYGCLPETPVLLDKLQVDQLRYLSFCLGRPSASGLNFDFSYVHEMSTLMLKQNCPTPRDVLLSKHPLEDVYVEGISDLENY